MRPDDVVTVLQSRQHDDRYRRIAFAQIGEHGEAVAIRQVEVEKNEVEVGMVLDDPHRLAAIGRLEHRRVAPQLLEDAAQRVTNQGVIVDDENFHPNAF